MEEDEPEDDEAAIKLADDIADRFVVYGKPTRIAANFDSEVFEKELYRRPRLAYLG